LASAAVVAAATPILRELIRTLSGRETAIRERRLVPVEDSAGEVLRDETGEPTLYWKNVAANSAESSQNIKIKGFGIEISFGG
jgi:ssDNA-binding replication factor A large subunit